MFKYNILTFVFLTASANSLFAATNPKDAPNNKAGNYPWYQKPPKRDDDKHSQQDDPEHSQRDDPESLWERAKNPMITGAYVVGGIVLVAVYVYGAGIAYIQINAKIAEAQANIQNVLNFVKESPFATGLATGAAAVAIPVIPFAYIAHEAVKAERASNQELIQLQKDEIQFLLAELKKESKE